ncbi:MAG: hypothetical protein GY696_36920, partial [Gammaproteobacteria bacterium]|nr:hypothetical protein [Gammaproteobacteria bacterium]
EGSLNVADIGTRGVSVDEIKPGSTWQDGPTWMTLPESEFPVRTFEEIGCYVGHFYAVHPPLLQQQHHQQQQQSQEPATTISLPSKRFINSQRFFINSDNEVHPSAKQCF